MDILGRFQSFIEECEDEEGKLIYMDKIRRMEQTGSKSLNISYNDLLRHDPALAEEIRLNPEETLALGEEVLRSMVSQISPNYLERINLVHIRILDLTDKVLLRALKTEHLGLLTCFEGIVIGVTEAKPLMIRGVFKCVVCGEGNQIVDFPEGIYTPPYQCRNEQCQRKGSLSILLERSTFIDWQKITIQEKPEELPPGQLPQSIMIHILDDLVDRARPGDRVEIVGILKARATRLLKRGALATYNKFFQGISIDKEKAEYIDIEITEEDERKIIDLSKSPLIIQKIRESLAPSIYGHDLVKEAIATLLFGGTFKKTPDGINLRGESNILLIGDPGVGKSQLLKFVQKLAPRAIYTTGKGSTAAGLCVAGNSEIFLSDGVVKISDVVNKEFEEGNIEFLNETMEYKKLKGTEVRTFHSKNLKLEENHISRMWRIKSPNILNRIITQTGKEITLTPETGLLSLTDGKLLWKPAKILKKGDRIATARKLSITKGKEIPSTYDLIKDYPNNILLLNVSRSVGKLIGIIKKKYSMTNKEISQELGVSEDAIYQWKNNDRVGNISLSLYQKICSLSEIPIEKKLPEFLEIETKRGNKIILPSKLDETWFYILGIMFGDGRVSVDDKEGRYGGVCLGFSNREETLLTQFREFCEQLSLKVTIIEGCKERPTEYLVWSKILYHILNKFGLVASSKSDRLSPHLDILSYPSEYLNSFLRGLFDSDGWISIRDESGSSQIGFSSTSKDLVKFVQNALLSYGIITYSRTRKPRVTADASSSRIFSKKLKYELTFNSFSEFRIFEKHIGFLHPKKRKLLSDYCLREKSDHRNVDNIPYARVLLKSIVNFYGYTSRELTGYKGAFAPSQHQKAMSKWQLRELLAKIETKWQRHRVKIPYEMRYRFYQDVIQFYGKENLRNLMGISDTQQNEYFMRKNRDPKISMWIFVKILENPEFHPSIEIKDYFSKLFLEVKQEDKIHKDKYKLLEQLCNSDIYWDKIIKAEEVLSKDDFVYDFTIPETHNFIVNGFVTHNTAAVLRDQDTGEITLEAGALVLADQGIAMIDEFDKMRADDRVAIHEAMEQHTVSIAKAGIVATLNTRTSILAAANPRRGRWNPYKDPADNLNLPPTILSRFDLLFVLEDKPHPQEDHEKASHILNIHQSQTLPVDPPIEQDLLRKYIAYARREIRPLLTDEARIRLLEYYKELRQVSGKIDEKGPDPIAITPRQLESLVRLSEARAKMRLSDEVSFEDASGAINLMNATLEKLAKDTETGKLDIDMVSSGISARSRRKLDQIDAVIDRILEKADDEPVAIKDIVDAAVEEGLDKAQVVKSIDEMTRRGVLFEPTTGHVKRP